MKLLNIKEQTCTFIDLCRCKLEKSKGPRISHHSNGHEMYQLCHTEQIICVVWMVGLVLQKIESSMLLYICTI